ncbi:MAG: PTS transporter subunit EIIC [Firmicutes bacterium]|nr:PTS transporter subunit EIIC [Bacillota bacterium]
MQGKGFFLWVEAKIIPPLAKAARWKPAGAVQKGILFALPVLAIGTVLFFFLVPESAVITKAGHTKLLITLAKLLIAFRAALTLMGLAASITIAYRLAQVEKMSPLFYSLASFIAVFLSFPLNIRQEFNILNIGGAGKTILFMAELSSSCLFVSIILSITVVMLGKLFKNLRELNESGIIKICSNLLSPVIIILILVFLQQQGIDLHHFVFILVKPVMYAGDTLPLGLMIVLLITFLWMAGIHGPAVVFPLVTPIYLTLLAENAKVVAEGSHSVPPHIITTPFFSIIFAGGAGSTLILAIMMLFAKSKKMRNLGKVSFIPGFFNINEMMMFGIPIVMNPVIWLPFIAAPVICCILTYTAMYFNIIARPYFYVPGIGMLPSPVIAFLSTGGDWRAPVMALINIAVSGFIYYPFFKSIDQKYLEEEKLKHENR